MSKKKKEHGLPPVGHGDTRTPERRAADTASLIAWLDEQKRTTETITPNAEQYLSADDDD